MRRVFLAGAAVAVICLVASCAIRLLNIPNDWSVAAGYFLFLAMISVLSGLAWRLWRRL